MRAHPLRIAGIAAAALLAVFYSFLPGPYDPAAVPVSTAVQLYGAAGLLLLPLAGSGSGPRSAPKPDGGMGVRRYLQPAGPPS